jgi:ABC-type branched-subunit amino acid transport system ATPase component
MSLFAVENSVVRFGGVVAVDGVSLGVHQDEVHIIIGANGRRQRCWLRSERLR